MTFRCSCDFRPGSRRLARRLVLAPGRLAAAQGRPRGLRAFAHRPGRARATWPARSVDLDTHIAGRRRSCSRWRTCATSCWSATATAAWWSPASPTALAAAHRAPGLPRRLRARERQMPARLRGARARRAHAPRRRAHRLRHPAADGAWGLKREKHLDFVGPREVRHPFATMAQPIRLRTRRSGPSCRRPSSTAPRPRPAPSTSSPRSTARRRPGASTSCRPGTTP